MDVNVFRKAYSYVYACIGCPLAVAQGYVVVHICTGTRYSSTWCTLHQAVPASRQAWQGWQHLRTSSSAAAVAANAVEASASFWSRLDALAWTTRAGLTAKVPAERAEHLLLLTTQLLVEVSMFTVACAGGL